MTADEFVDALHNVGLSHASQEAGDFLGYDVRHVQRLAMGASPVPLAVERLLLLMAAIDITAQDWEEYF